MTPSLRPPRVSDIPESPVEDAHVDVSHAACSFAIQGAVNLHAGGSIQSMAEPVGLWRQPLKQAPLENFSVDYIPQDFAPESLPPMTVEDLRANARQTLLYAAATGRLVEAIREVTSEEHDRQREEMRDRARGRLLHAAATGALGQTIRQLSFDEKEELHNKARNRLLHAAATGDLLKTIGQFSVDGQEGGKARANGEQQQDTLRKQLAEAFVTSMDSGELNHILREAWSGPQSERSLAQSAAGMRAEEANWSLAGGALSTMFLQVVEEPDSSPSMADLAGSMASRMGNVPEKLRLDGAEEIRDADQDIARCGGTVAVEEVRSQVRSCLFEASENGSLAAAVLSMHKERKAMEFDELRTRAFSTLLKASYSGTLTTALRELREEPATKQSDVDTLRLQAFDCLVKASASGQLNDVLAELKQDERAAKMETLREQAFHALAEASFSGELDAAIGEVRGASKESTAFGNSQIDALRQQACHRLMEASANGRLEVVLSDMQQKENLKQVRQRACEVFMEASINGQLEAVLADVRQGSADSRCLNSREDTFSPETALAKDCIKGLLGTLSGAASDDAGRSTVGNITPDLLAESTMYSGTAANSQDSFYGRQTAAAGQPMGASGSPDWETATLNARSILCAATENAISEDYRSEVYSVTPPAQGTQAVERVRDEARGALVSALQTGVLPSILGSVLGSKTEAKDGVRPVEQASCSYTVGCGQARGLEDATKLSPKAALVPKPPSKPSAHRPRPSRPLSMPLKPGLNSTQTILTMIENCNRKVGSLHAQIEETEHKLQDRDVNIAWLQGEITSTLQNLQHITTDLQWHQRQLEDAKARGHELDKHRRVAIMELEEMRRTREASAAGFPGQSSVASTKEQFWKGSDSASSTQRCRTWT